MPVREECEGDIGMREAAEYSRMRNYQSLSVSCAESVDSEPLSLILSLSQFLTCHFHLNER